MKQSMGMPQGKSIKGMSLKATRQGVIGTECARLEHHSKKGEGEEKNSQQGDDKGIQRQCSNRNTIRAPQEMDKARG